MKIYASPNPVIMTYTFAAASMVAISIEKPWAMASRSIFDVASKSND